MLSGSENVITDNNAILHATLYNAQAEGINVKAFKWTIYKGKISNNVVVKSIEKVNTAAGNKIEIECNVNKDMGIKLEPNTEYWYQIVTIADKDLNMQLFSQSHYFTTLAEGQEPKESTSVAETSTVQITTPQETSTTKIKASKITSVKVKKAKGTSKKSVLIKFKKVNGDILENNKEVQHDYKEYMQKLFTKYGKLVDEGLPIEDCRYILPYSYHSNIIMGCDANELFRITSDLLNGKISQIDEVKELGEKLKNILKENCPYLLNALEEESTKDYYEDKFTYLDDKLQIDNKLLDKTQLIDYNKDADDKVLCSILMNRYQVSYTKAKKILKELEKDDSKMKYL